MIVCEVLGDESQTEEGGSRPLHAVCPGKDLVAVASSKRGHVRVHRCSVKWELLADLCCTSRRVTSLCWRPDGLLLASAHDDGSCFLHAPESGACWACPRPPGVGQTAPVVALCWASRHCPSPALPLPTGASNLAESMGGLGATFPVAWESVDVLCCLDGRGTVSLLAYGSFPVGVARVGGPEGVQGRQFREVMMVDDLSAVVAVARGRGQTERFVVETGGIAKASTDVRGASRCLWALQGSAKALLDVVTTSASKWRRVEDLLSKRRRGFEQLLKDNGSNCSPEQDLISFLATAIPSPAMEQFVGTDKRMNIKPLECAFAAAQYCVSTELPPLAKQLEASVVSLAAAVQLYRGSSLALSIPLSSHLHCSSQSFLQREETDKLLEQLRTSSDTLSITLETIASLTCRLKSLFARQFGWISQLPNDVAESLAKGNVAWPAAKESAGIVECLKEAPGIISQMPDIWAKLSELAERVCQSTSAVVASTLLVISPDVSRVSEPAIGPCNRSFCLPHSAAVCTLFQAEDLSTTWIQVHPLLPVATNDSQYTLPIVEPASFEEGLALCRKLLSPRESSHAWESRVPKAIDVLGESLLDFAILSDGRLLLLHKNAALASVALSLFSMPSSQAASMCLERSIPTGRDASSITVASDRPLCAVHHLGGRLVIIDLSSS